MSVSWSFYSFEIERWNTIFGGGLPGAFDAVISSATWEDQLDTDSADAPVFSDDAEVQLIKRIVENGISYNGLDEEDACLLDRIISGFWCPEGIETLLGFAYESNEFVNMKLILELVRRANGMPLQAPKKQTFVQRMLKTPAVHVETLATTQLNLLPYLQSGRRIHSEAAPPEDLYLILSPTESAALSAEITSVLALPTPWAWEYAATDARDNLVRVLDKAHSNNRWLAGRYC